MDNLEQKLSKREKYLLKRQRKEEEHLHLNSRKKRKKLSRFVLLILLVGGFIAGAGYLVVGLVISSSEGNNGTPKIEINPQKYDAGTVSMSEGLVKFTYEIKNIGDGDLKISNIRTSCMCTTARLRVGEEESGEFGMHDVTTFWSQKIAPGETGFLDVTFDPAFHGDDAVGQVVRAIYISSNDPQNKKIEVRLIANVIAD